MEKVCIGLIVILVIMLFIQPSVQEGFWGHEPLPYGDLGKPILHDYKERKSPQLTNNGSQQIYTDYPVFPAHSYINNNIRYWQRPTNGKCSPAEFCGSLYDSTHQTIPGPLQAQPWSGVTRVNYYGSCR